MKQLSVHIYTPSNFSHRRFGLIDECAWVIAAVWRGAWLGTSLKFWPLVQALPMSPGHRVTVVIFLFLCAIYVVGFFLFLSFWVVYKLFLAVLFITLCLILQDVADYSHSPIVQ